MVKVVQKELFSRIAENEPSGNLMKVGKIGLKWIRAGTIPNFCFVLSPQTCLQHHSRIWCNDLTTQLCCVYLRPANI